METIVSSFIVKEINKLKKKKVISLETAISIWRQNLLSKFLIYVGLKTIKPLISILIYIGLEI